MSDCCAECGDQLDFGTCGNVPRCSRAMLQPIEPRIEPMHHDARGRVRHAAADCARLVRYQQPWYAAEPAPLDALLGQYEDLITCADAGCHEQAVRFAREQARSPKRKASRAEYVAACRRHGYRPHDDDSY